jgi:uncharacterized membrane protein
VPDTVSLKRATARPEGMSAVDRVGVDPERGWLAGVAVIALAVIGGSLAFPEAVYDRFVWQYFWGPVQADAHAAACAVRAGGTVEYLQSGCGAATGIVAYPGYTIVSEVGYAVLLLIGVGGVVLLLRRLGLGTDRRFVYALVPFVFFGGALRVVEDATDGPATEALIAYPYNTLVISPIIYVTVFLITLAAVLAAVELARRGVVDDYARPLFAFGTVAVLLTVGFLAWLGIGGPVDFHPQVLAVVVGLATLSAGIVWLGLDRFAPSVNDGTGALGLVVLWAHAVDGAANVVGLDWLTALGAGPNLVPKHPLNLFIVETTASILPASVEAAIGSAWSFLLVKLAVASLVLWAFDERAFEESPRFTVLLVLAVVAVGLGPGTRDLLRATLGV